MGCCSEFMSHTWGGMAHLGERWFCCRRRRAHQDKLYQAEVDLAEGRDVIRRYNLLIALIKEVLAEDAVQKNVQRLVQGVQEVVGCEHVSLFMAESGRGLVCLASGFHTVGGVVKPGVGLVGLVAETGASINIPDVQNDPSVHASLGTQPDASAHSVLCVALKDQRGEVIAIVEAVNKKCALPEGGGFATMVAVTPTEPAPFEIRPELHVPFDETDEKMLKVILSLVSEQLRVLAISETRERATRQVESLLTMVGGMSAALREGRMALGDVADAMLDQLNCESIFLFVVEAKQLVIRARSPEPVIDDKTRRRTLSLIAPSQGVLDSVMNCGEPRLLGTEEIEELESLREVLPDVNARPISALLCPLRLRDGCSFGVVVAVNKVLCFDQPPPDGEDEPTLHRKINKVLKKLPSSVSNDSRSARLCTRSVATSFSNADLTRVRALSSFVTHCVLTSEVYQKQNASNATLSALLTFCTETVRATHRGIMEDMVRSICYQGRLIFACEFCRFFVIDSLSDSLFCWFLDDEEDDSSELKKERVPKSGIVGLCIKEEKPVNLSGVCHNPSFSKGTDMINGDVAQSIMCQPIRAPGGRAVAALQCVNKLNGKEFDAEDDLTFGIISDLVSDVLLNMAANASLDLLMERNDVHQDVKETMQMFTAHDKKRTRSMEPNTALETAATGRRKKLGVAQFLSLQGSMAIEDLLTWTFDYGAYTTHGAVDGIPVALNFYNLLRKFKLDKMKLTDTLLQVQGRYKQNPYHNWCHAFCTFHVLFLVLSDVIPMLQLSAGSMELLKLDQLAVLLAALAHDVGHRGRNNGFEIETRSDLAITYNDRSPLESHHAAVACAVFFQPAEAVMGALSTEESKRARAVMIDSILHTDMCDHQKNLIWLQSNSLMSAKTSKNDSGAAHGGSGDSMNCADASKKLCCALLHGADLGHPCLPWESHKRFSLMACQEFYDQYQEESRLGLPTLPFMSKDPKGPLEDLAPSQAGFVNFVVAPLWTALSTFTEKKLQFIVENVMHNKRRWDCIAAGQNVDDEVEFLSPPSMAASERTTSTTL